MTLTTFSMSPWFYLLSLACLALSLAPTTMAPAERAFEQGQPEMPQSMDNDILLKAKMYRKSVEYPSERKGFPALLIHKASALRLEAERMLNKVKDPKDRRWLEVFVDRMKMLTPDFKPYPTEDSVEKQEPKIFAKKNAQPDSIGTFLPSTQSSAVPDTAKQHPAVQVTSKSPSTMVVEQEISPKISHPTEMRVVDEFGLEKQVESVEKEDELVRELESLNKMPIPTPNPALERVTAITTLRPEIVSETPEKRMDVLRANQLAIINEKARIRANLAQEVSELERLGETEDEILHTLHLNAHRYPGALNQNMMLSHRPLSNGNAYRNLIFPMKNGMKYVNSNGAVIPYGGPNVWRHSTMHPMSYPSKHSSMNNSQFESVPMNWHPFNNPMAANQFEAGTVTKFHPIYPQQFHPEGIKNRIQKWHGQHQNYPVMVQPFDTVSEGGKSRQVQSMGTQNPFLPAENKFFPNSVIHSYRPGQGAKLPYTPYPYIPIVEQKNSSFQGDKHMKTTFSSESFSDHNLESEMNDEMKRQLRDGKVIILSDSVVRTNFDTSPKNEKGKSEKESPTQDSDTSKGNATKT